ncbi:hypothetical protein GQR58_030329 [Nymphon striatum]|nr:hypothetical protein GQR58_030329 [Nymphon striatum]
MDRTRDQAQQQKPDQCGSDNGGRQHHQKRKAFLKQKLLKVQRRARQIDRPNHAVLHNNRIGHKDPKAGIATERREGMWIKVIFARPEFCTDIATKSVTYAVPRARRLRPTRVIAAIIQKADDRLWLWRGMTPRMSSDRPSAKHRRPSARVHWPGLQSRRWYLRAWPRQQ